MLWAEAGRAPVGPSYNACEVQTSEKPVQSLIFSLLIPINLCSYLTQKRKKQLINYSTVFPKWFLRLFSITFVPCTLQNVAKVKAYLSPSPSFSPPNPFWSSRSNLCYQASSLKPNKSLGPHLLSSLHSPTF